MKRLFMLSMIFSLFAIPLTGCDKKKAETKPETKTDAAPEKAAEPAAK